MEGWGAALFLEKLVGNVARCLFAVNVRLKSCDLLSQQRDTLLQLLYRNEPESWPIS